MGDGIDGDDGDGGDDDDDDDDDADADADAASAAATDDVDDDDDDDYDDDDDDDDAPADAASAAAADDADDDDVVVVVAAVPHIDLVALFATWNAANPFSHHSRFLHQEVRDWQRLYPKHIASLMTGSKVMSYM